MDMDFWRAKLVGLFERVNTLHLEGKKRAMWWQRIRSLLWVAATGFLAN